MAARCYVLSYRSQGVIEDFSVWKFSRKCRLRWANHIWQNSTHDNKNLAIGTLPLIQWLLTITPVNKILCKYKGHALVSACHYNFVVYLSKNEGCWVIYGLKFHERCSARIKSNSNVAQSPFLYVHMWPVADYWHRYFAPERGFNASSLMRFGA